MAENPSTPNLPFGPPGSQKKPKYPQFHYTRSDSSIFPSYTNLGLPYRVKCRQRYWNSYKEQRRQFISEVAMQELLQAMALDGVRVHREFCKYIFSKPSAKEKITLTEAEERSVGSTPLSLWDKQVKNGHIRRVIDDEVKSLVLEISGTNVATTYITCPIKPRASLSIRLPFLVMIVKNMKKYFTFEIQILDDKDMHRRFRVSNFQSTTKVRPFCTTMPIGLSSGWNQIQFNLADFTRRAYGTLYLETMRVQIHANVRIRRIYFADRLYSEDEMPSEYRLFVPLSTKEKAKEPEKESSVKGSKTSKLSQPKEPEEPSAAPPSPVLTEAPMMPTAEEVQVNVEQYGDETATEEMRTDTEVTEMTEEPPQSEEPVSEIAPSEDAPPTEEPATDVEGAAEAPPPPEAEQEVAPPAEPEPPMAEPEAPPADAAEPEEKPAE